MGIWVGVKHLWSSPTIKNGGDVYGWRQLENGSALFWVADATGHGIAAALFTTLVTPF